MGNVTIQEVTTQQMKRQQGSQRAGQGLGFYTSGPPKGRRGREQLAHLSFFAGGAQHLPWTDSGPPEQRGDLLGWQPYLWWVSPKSLIGVQSYATMLLLCPLRG